MRRDGGRGFSSFRDDSRWEWACKIALWKVEEASAGTLGRKQQEGHCFIRERGFGFITGIWSFMVIVICHRIIMLICLLLSCLGGEWIGGLGAVGQVWRSRQQSRPLGGRRIHHAQIGDPAQQCLLRFNQEVLLWATERDRAVAYSYLMQYGPVSSSMLHLTWLCH